MQRSYHQFCGLAQALDRVGERWTLLIVRDLLLGPHRYGDLLAALPGITTNLLAKRLRDLQRLGLIEKQKLDPPAGATVYALTPLGASLEPALMALGAWGFRFLDKPKRGLVMNTGWALVSLKRRFRLDIGRGTVELVVQDATFQVRFDERSVTVRRGAPFAADVRIRTDFATMGSLFFRGASADALAASGKLVIEPLPDDATWPIFLRAFDLV